MTISLNGLDHATVLAALYNRARPQGMGFLRYTPEPMTVAEAQVLLDRFPEPYFFDYLKGRVMKIDLSEPELDTAAYNRDNGADAAEQAIAALRTQEATP